MIDVIEQLQARRSDALDHLYGPCRMVGMVVLVVDLAVQHFQAEGDAVALGTRGDALEPGNAVGDPFAIRQPGTIATEAHDIRHARRRGFRHQSFGVSDELVVIVRPVESPGMEPNPFAIAHASPSCFATAQSCSSSRSIAR